MWERGEVKPFAGKKVKKFNDAYNKQQKKHADINNFKGKYLF